MAATIASLADGLRELMYKNVNNTYAIVQALQSGGTGGGGTTMTEYTEGDVVPSIIGTAFLWEDGANTLRSVSAAKPLPVNVVGSTDFAGVPSNFAVQTSDQTVFTLAAGERGFIQNLHTTALAVKFGASGTTINYSMILSGGTAQDDGKGEKLVIYDEIGTVSVAAMTGAPRYMSWKQAP